VRLRTYFARHRCRSTRSGRAFTREEGAFTICKNAELDGKAVSITLLKEALLNHRGSLRMEA
jgi:hypothetical protein